MNREQWLEWRRSHIGASDIGPIVLGDVFGRGPLDVYLDKRGLVPPQDETADMRRGTRLEALAAERLRERPEFAELQYPVSDYERFAIPYLCEDDWQSATIDAYLQPATGFEPVEIKCPRMAGFLKAKANGPESHQLLQVQWQLALTDAARGWLVVFHADPWDLLVFEVPRDEELIAKCESEAAKLWACVEAGTPPESPAPPAWVAPPKAKPADMRDSEEWRAALGTLAICKGAAKAAKDDADAAEEKVKFMLDAENIESVTCGEFKATYREQDGKVTLDRKTMIAHGVDPTLFEKRGQPFKVLRFTTGKEKD